MDYHYDYSFFMYLREDLLTDELFFKLCVPQRYVYKLERNWKNSACIGVKNFANLSLSF